MRFVIFTPTVKASAIGRSTSLVTQALKKSGHAVAVVRSEVVSLMQTETHDFGVELVPWTASKQVEELVRGADALVYQIGDNYTYHRGCLEWLERAPGIVCLHDFFLGHLFWDMAQNSKAAALATVRAWYGDAIAKVFFSYKNSDAFIEATKDTAPMTEWVCSMAQGVITHSSWGIQRVLDSCPGPVQIVPLAYDAPAAELVMRREVERASPKAEFNVLTVGHVNPNKRPESVIRAIGNSTGLREYTTYRLVGKILPLMAERLTDLAKTLQVNLVISKEVDAETLLQAIGDAHAICCLRWPSLEAASASAIEAMLYGKPLVVTDTGFYAELPGDCVRKIREDNEIPDLQLSLEWLAKNESGRVALGRRAADWGSVARRIAE